MKFNFPPKSYCCTKHFLALEILCAPPLPPLRFLKLEHGRHERAVLVAFLVQEQ